MIAATAVQTWIACVGIACIAFSTVLLALASLAQVAGYVERRHARRHARRRGGYLGESFPRAEP